MVIKLSYAAYMLALVGGIIIVLFGLFDLLGVVIREFRALEILPLFGGTIRTLFRIIIGIVCIAGSRKVSTLTWGIILLILGIFAGNLGGTLVLIGAILGLISTTQKPRRR